MKNQNATSILGGEGKAVLIDETYFTKKKKQSAGFRGKSTAGNQKCLLAGIELDLTTRTCTGKTFIMEIAGPKRRYIEPIIQQFIEPGSIIWSDGHAAYKFLRAGAPHLGELSPTSGYRWDFINHKKSQFAKLIHLLILLDFYTATTTTLCGDQN